MRALNDAGFMALAIRRAREQVRRGRRPIWCVIVDARGRVVGQAGNTVARDRDPSAHGEVNAIRKACARLRTLDLSGCTLYSPMEPCPICLSTMLDARISRVVVGARHQSPVGRKDLGRYSMERLLRLTGRKLEIVPMKVAESMKLRRAWLVKEECRRAPRRRRGTRAG
jgi:tRNA(Arg) A34 adenosine deaminase TadA